MDGGIREDLGSWIWDLGSGIWDLGINFLNHLAPNSGAFLFEFRDTSVSLRGLEVRSGDWVVV